MCLIKHFLGATKFGGTAPCGYGTGIFACSDILITVSLLQERWSTCHNGVVIWKSITERLQIAKN